LPAGESGLTDVAQALIPLKDLVRAKTRLAGLLSGSERRGLVQAMLEDVLTVLAVHPQIGRVVLLSDDPSAHLLAAQYGAVHWPERELGGRGLNTVLRLASDRLLAVSEQPLLVLHADLPLLTGDDITAALTAQRKTGGLAVGCDRHGWGTNLLCFEAASAPPFCFGADSCARHLAAAAELGVAAGTVHSVGIGLDVDEPVDLARLLELLPGHPHSAGQTAAFIQRSALQPRIRLALASLAPAGARDNGREVG
jgi:2-phospho-L-lactate guanylyltransferase